MTDARNTFAKQSGAYAVARPRYPAGLYDWIQSQCERHDSAWDCATGNGQAAIDLARRFARVYASDISPEQVGHGSPAQNIVYSVESAEQTSYPDGEFDLVAVAQALHWFDYARFWPEVSRVARPGALFCAWGYAWFSCDPEILNEVVLPFRALIEPFWAANNRLLWHGYRSEEISFPYKRIETPRFTIELDWNVPELIAYMQTWSASKRAAEDDAAGAELSQLTDSALTRLAGFPRFTVSMPIEMVAGRVAT